VQLKTNVTEEVAALLTVYMHERGYQTTADCLREMVEVMLLGRDHVLSVHQHRIGALDRNWAGIGPVRR
jgi:hypothetical protein